MRREADAPSSGSLLAGMDREAGGCFVSSSMVLQSNFVADASSSLEEEEEEEEEEEAAASSAGAAEAVDAHRRTCVAMAELQLCTGATVGAMLHARTTAGAEHAGAAESTARTQCRRARCWAGEGREQERDWGRTHKLKHTHGGATDGGPTCTVALPRGPARTGNRHHRQQQQHVHQNNEGGSLQRGQGDSKGGLDELPTGGRHLQPPSQPMFASTMRQTGSNTQTTASPARVQWCTAASTTATGPKVAQLGAIRSRQLPRICAPSSPHHF